eukprot:767580-Hanusia_phi.AAC.2
MFAVSLPAGCKAYKRCSELPSVPLPVRGGQRCRAGYDPMPCATSDLCTAEVASSPMMQSSPNSPNGCNNLERSFSSVRGLGLQGPSRQKQLEALQHCISMLTSENEAERSSFLMGALSVQVGKAMIVKRHVSTCWGSTVKC